MPKYCPICWNSNIDPTLGFCSGCGAVLPPYPVDILPKDVTPNPAPVPYNLKRIRKGFIPKVTIDPRLGNPENAKDVDDVLSKLHFEVLSKLYDVSRNTGQVVYVFSAYRPPLTPLVNEDLSAHQFRLGVDATIPGYNSEQVAYELWRVGFNGLGVKHNHDGSLKQTAHGDIRGEPAADYTPFAKNKPDGKPFIWDEVERTEKEQKDGKGKWKNITREYSPEQKSYPYIPIEKRSRGSIAESEIQKNIFSSAPNPKPVYSRWTKPPQPPVEPSQFPVTPDIQGPRTESITKPKSAPIGEQIVTCCGVAIFLVIAFFFVIPWIAGPHPPPQTAEERCQEMAQEYGDVKSCGYCGQDIITSSNPYAGKCRFCPVGATCPADPCSQTSCNSPSAESSSSDICTRSPAYCQAQYINQHGWTGY
jgi:hypothetical protein